MPKMQVDGSAASTAFRSIGFPRWFFPWIGIQVRYHQFVGLFMLGSAIVSPLLWIVCRVRKKMPSLQLFIFWLILYSVCWLWLVNAPDYRYGIPFLTILFADPCHGAGRDREAGIKMPVPRWPRWALSILFILSTSYYLYGAYGAYRLYAAKKAKAPDFEEGWLYPFRDVYYKEPDGKDSIPYKMLNMGDAQYRDKALFIRYRHICASMPD